MANSVDPDQMARSAPSDLRLHCLNRHVCTDTRGYYMYDTSQCHYVTSTLRISLHRPTINNFISQHLSGLTYFVGCSTYVAASASHVFPKYMNEQRHNKRCLREICEQ